MTREILTVSLGSLLAFIICVSCVQSSTLTENSVAVKPTAAEFSPPKANAVMVLAKDGKSCATIIIKKDATDLQRGPAEELQDYIHKITGAVLPIVDDTRQPEGNLILVGQSRFTKEVGIDTSKFAADSFIIKTSPGRLVLAGNDSDLGVSNSYVPTKKRGTVNAVNVFLQDYCGVRWFMPGKLGEVVPKKKTLEIGEIDKREQFFRLYATGVSIEPKWKQWSHHNFFGSSVFLRHTGGHLWYYFVPSDKYFKEHPEWFALLDGKRTGKGNHLCPTNKQMWAEALKNLKNIYAQGYEMVELGQTDGYQRCRCERCEATDEYRDNVGYYVPSIPADRIWLFHNFLAEEIQKAYPDRRIMIISYGPTGEVPHKIKKLPDNVTVEWCHQDPELIQRWRKFHSAPFTVYLYWFIAETRDYIPMSMFDIHSVFKRLTSAGANGYFFCGVGSCWGTNAPTYYLLGQLVRDPNADAEEVLNEFCCGLFEDAAEPMEDFFKTFYRRASRADKLSFEPEVIAKPYIRPKKYSVQDVYPDCFTDSVLSVCEKSLKHAERLANNDTVRKRISFFRDGFEYIKLTTYGFARSRDYEKDSSSENLVALKEAVRRRNQFVRQMNARQKVDYQKGLLPLVLRPAKDNIDDLLYGGRRRLKHPFNMDIDTKEKILQ